MRLCGGSYGAQRVCGKLLAQRRAFMCEKLWCLLFTTINENSRHAQHLRDPSRLLPSLIGPEVQFCRNTDFGGVAACTRFEGLFSPRFTKTHVQLTTSTTSLPTNSYHRLWANNLCLKQTLEVLPRDGPVAFSSFSLRTLHRRRLFVRALHVVHGTSFNQSTTTDQQPHRQLDASLSI
jgi:hypothetical protein